MKNVQRLWLQGLHRDFACLLFSHLTHKPTLERIHAIVRDAVKIEQVFMMNLRVNICKTRASMTEPGTRCPNIFLKSSKLVCEEV